MAKEKDGWVTYWAPKLDDQGWHINEEDSRNKSQRRHNYPDQQTAQDAYMGMLLGSNRACH